MCNNYSTKKKKQNTLECRMCSKISDTSSSSSCSSGRRHFQGILIWHLCYSITSWMLRGLGNLQRDWERSLPSHFLHHRMARSEFLFLDQPSIALPLRCGATCCNHKTQRISLPGGPVFLQGTCAWKRQLGRSPKTIQSNLICFCSTLESGMLLNMQPNYYYE